MNHRWKNGRGSLINTLRLTNMNVHIRRDPLSIEHYASDVQWCERESLECFRSKTDEEWLWAFNQSIIYVEILCQLNTISVLLHALTLNVEY